jgi:hypothetical protein
MPESNDLAKAHREAAALLGLDPAHPLCPADGLRVDLVSTLRLVIDAAGETVLEGGSVDLSRLVNAVETLIRLLPGRELPQPAREHDRNDPQRLLFEMYMAARRRGGVSDEGKIVDGLRDEVEALQAEVAELKAGLAGNSDILTVVERVPAFAAGNVVPLQRPSPPAAPAYDYDRQRGWRDHVLPDGSIV